MTTAEQADWVSLTREEPVDPKRRIIDAHHHLWGNGEGLGGAPDYLHANLLADIDGHNVQGSVYIECSVSYRPDGPEEFRSVGETEFAAGEALRSRDTKSPILAIVAHADLACENLQDILDAHAEAGAGLFRGIRQLPGGMADRPPRDLLNEPAFREGAARLGKNGYSFDAFSMVGQLADLASLARAVPETTIILNHVGMPVYRPDQDSRDSVMAAWRDGMRKVAACPNLLVKLGGIGMDVMFGTGWSKREHPPTSDEVVAWWGDDLRFCIDTFGPDRCLFESNFPVDRWSIGYTVLWNAFQKIAAPYSGDEQDALFAGTAERAYRLEG